MELKFVNEPPENRGSAKYKAVLAETLAELKNHPNKWAEFPIQVSYPTMPSQWRQQHPEFSFRVSGGNTLAIKDPNKKLWTVYIRYNKPEPTNQSYTITADEFFGDN